MTENSNDNISKDKIKLGLNIGKDTLSLPKSGNDIKTNRFKHAIGKSGNRSIVEIKKRINLHSKNSNIAPKKSFNLTASENQDIEIRMSALSKRDSNVSDSIISKDNFSEKILRNSYAYKSSNNESTVNKTNSKTNSNKLDLPNDTYNASNKPKYSENENSAPIKAKEYTDINDNHENEEEVIIEKKKVSKKPSLNQKDSKHLKREIEAALLSDDDYSNEEDIDDGLLIDDLDSEIKAVKTVKSSTNLKKYQKKQVPVKKEIELSSDVIMLKDLARKMSIKLDEIIKLATDVGVVNASINTEIDADIGELIIREKGYVFKKCTKSDIYNVIVNVLDFEADSKDIVLKVPIVTIMGHVDHGKTSLLDYIRESRITEKESGGITQHIGAYQISSKSDDKITFLDTPGHAAFTAMRERGANVTDIVILVVAADDGIKEQTIEALNHAKAAKVPIIVAINKIDKPGANPKKVREQLLQHDLICEEFGGEIMSVEVSAVSGQGIDDLLDTIVLRFSMLEKKARISGPAYGVIIEAKMDKQTGVMVTLIVEQGVLKKGDIVICDECYGKVRFIRSDLGKNIIEVYPSGAVEIMGFGGLPTAGSKFYVVSNEKIAKELIDYNKNVNEGNVDKEEIDENMASLLNIEDLEELLDQVDKTSMQKNLFLIIKGDVFGSVEAIKTAVTKLENEECKIKIVHYGVGGITLSDIALASASSAENSDIIILGFSVRAESAAVKVAKQKNVNIKYYTIIYDLIEDIQNMIKGKMDDKIEEIIIGSAEVRNVFNIKKFGKICGCHINSGKIERNYKVRVIRDSVVIQNDFVKSLRKVKEDVSEVTQGFECGILLNKFNDIKVGDYIECFIEKKID